MNNSLANLIKMANQIGDFFGTMRDREQSLGEIADHLRRFWEPRMRQSLMAHLDQQAGAGLSDIVIDSLRAHRERVV